ncbi:MAG TPA: DNA/RNA non-specific endonuclease [Ensifer sp.]|nr:DNA/RNA non-specific endonuclease [Ensifer sp.]
MAIKPNALLLGLLLGAGPFGHLLSPALAAGLATPSDLSECAAIFDPVGVPDGHDGANERDYVYANGMKPDEPSEGGKPSPVLYKCYGTGFAVRLNAITRVPDWVAEDITPEEIGSEAERSNKFFVDETVQNYSSTLDDYRSSGFDRGHQAPAGDFSADQAMQDQTFVMSNMGPQVGACFNRGIWKDLEASLRNLVKTRQRLIVFTGPVYGDKLKAIGDVAKDKKGIQLAVPDAYFKVVYAPRDKRAMAFVISNAKHCDEAYSDAKFRVSIKSVEQQTGFTFFDALPPRLQTTLKAQPSPAWTW